MIREPFNYRRFFILLAFTLAGYYLFGMLIMGPRIFGGVRPLVMIPPGVIVGVWLEARIKRNALADYPRCGFCGYNLTGHETLLETKHVCPECGSSFADVPVILRGQPDKKQISRSNAHITLLGALLGTVLMSFASMLLLHTKYANRTWILAAPVVYLWYDVLKSWRQNRKAKP